MEVTAKIAPYTLNEEEEKKKHENINQTRNPDRPRLRHHDDRQGGKPGDDPTRRRLRSP